MVLKISGIEGDEPQTLAQLQHTYIVPIYSVHEDPRRPAHRVHALLRRRQPFRRPGPCLGGFAGTLAGRRACPGDGRRGRSRAGQRTGRSPPTGRCCRHASVPAPDTVDATLPTSYCLLSSTTYPQAAAWLVARLAEGLATPTCAASFIAISSRPTSCWEAMACPCCWTSISRSR